jgi:serine kinase of HPr protein (carbohydrate metabolism regulator)
MSTSVNIHASCVQVAKAGANFGAPKTAGVLLIGPSGGGKSDLALRLIGRGALLVSDDRTELFVRRGTLMASAPRTLVGLMEIRGIGIVERTHARSVPVALVVDLSGKVTRLPKRHLFAPPKALAMSQKNRPRLFFLSAFEDSAPDKVLAAVAALHNRSFRETVKRN